MRRNGVFRRNSRCHTAGLDKATNKARVENALFRSGVFFNFGAHRGTGAQNAVEIASNRPREENAKRVEIAFCNFLAFVGTPS